MINKFLRCWSLRRNSGGPRTTRKLAVEQLHARQLMAGDLCAQPDVSGLIDQLNDEIPPLDNLEVLRDSYFAPSAAGPSNDLSATSLSPLLEPGIETLELDTIVGHAAGDLAGLAGQIRVQKAINDKIQICQDAREALPERESYYDLCTSALKRIDPQRLIDRFQGNVAKAEQVVNGIRDYRGYSSGYFISTASGRPLHLGLIKRLD